MKWGELVFYAISRTHARTHTHTHARTQIMKIAGADNVLRHYNHYLTKPCGQLITEKFCWVFLSLEQNRTEQTWKEKHRTEQIFIKNDTYSISYITTYLQSYTHVCVSYSYYWCILIRKCKKNIWKNGTFDKEIYLHGTKNMWLGNVLTFC